MIKEITGFIIKEIPFGETSKIIHVYTKKGIISIMCKGARTLKSKERASTLKFTYARFLIKYKENKLSNLISVDVINPLSNIKSDIVLISYLNYITNLTEQVAKQSSTSIYDEFISAVLKIDSGLDPQIISNILELKYLDYLGISLNLDSCSICGKTDILTIDGTRGGFICNNCYHNELLVDNKTIEVIRKLYYVDIKSIKKIKISDKVKFEVNTFLNNYYETYSGIYLKSKDFIKKIL